MISCRLAALLGVLVAACGTGDPSADTPPESGPLPELFVNELMASNVESHADELGEFDDWVELYNAGDEAVDLDGYFVSDDPTDPFKRRLLAGLKILPDDVLVLWADRDPEQGVAHLPFKLTAAGESFLISTPNGVEIDSVTYADAPADQVFARFPDGSGEPILCATPTPGEQNGSACGGD